MDNGVPRIRVKTELSFEIAEIVRIENALNDVNVDVM